MIGLVIWAVPAGAAEAPVGASTINTQSIPDTPMILNDSYVVEISILEIPKYDLTPTEDGWCVSFVRKNGFEKYRGDAVKWIDYINSHTPEIGAVVMLNYGEIGHLALITEFREGKPWIHHQNFEGRGIISHGPLELSHVIGYVVKP